MPSESRSGHDGWGNARIVSVSLFAQNIQRPERLLRYGVAGRPVADHALPDGIFQNSLRNQNVFPELLRGHAVNEPVVVAVAGDFMAPAFDFPDQRPVSLTDPPRQKKVALTPCFPFAASRCRGPCECCARSSTRSSPLLFRHHRLERGDHVVVLEVDGQGVGDRVGHVYSVYSVGLVLSMSIPLFLDGAYYSHFTLVLEEFDFLVCTARRKKPFDQFLLSFPDFKH